jgi:tripartite-type tricarboxylate transporter receptor subunit TctC
MPRSHFAVVLAIGAALCTPVACAAQNAVADFYRRKQVTIMVGFGPGGSASLYAQALSRHMGRFLPGSPRFVVQHMPGAGGLVVANTISNTVPRDDRAGAGTRRIVQP